jgi:hypothetical protein
VGRIVIGRGLELVRSDIEDFAAQCDALPAVARAQSKDSVGCGSFGNGLFHAHFVLVGAHLVQDERDRPDHEIGFNAQGNETETATNLGAGRGIHVGNQYLTGIGIPDAKMGQVANLGTIETDYLASLRAASIFRFVHSGSKARKALGAAFSINSRRCHWGRDGRRKQALWSTSCH